MHIYIYFFFVHLNWIQDQTGDISVAFFFPPLWAYSFECKKAGGTFSGKNVSESDCEEFIGKPFWSLMKCHLCYTFYREAEVSLSFLFFKYSACHILWQSGIFQDSTQTISCPLHHLRMKRQHLNTFELPLVPPRQRSPNTSHPISVCPCWQITPFNWIQ